MVPSTPARLAYTARNSGSVLDHEPAEEPDTPVHWAVRSTHVQDRGYTAHGKDTPDKPLEGTGPEVCLVVATHAVTSSPPKVGVQRDEIVYELFVSTLSFAGVYLLGCARPLLVPRIV